MDMEKGFFLREGFIRENLKIIKCMELVLIFILMEIYMKGNGRIIFRMELENFTLKINKRKELSLIFIKDSLYLVNSKDLDIILIKNKEKAL